MEQAAQAGNREHAPAIIGVIVSTSSGANADIRVMHAGRGLPLISIEHDLADLAVPPDGQVTAWVAWSRCST